MTKQNRITSNPKASPLPYDQNDLFDFYLGIVITLREDWDAFNCLFMEPMRKLYLDAVYPVLADRICFLLTASVYTGVARLFDPLATFKDISKSNLVLRRVIDDLGPQVGTAERKRIEEDYAAMEPTVKSIKQWRNVFGAHLDLKTSLDIVDYKRSDGTRPHPLPFIPLGHNDRGDNRLREAALHQAAGASIFNGVC